MILIDCEKYFLGLTTGARENEKVRREVDRQLLELLEFGIYRYILNLTL